ncbi:hypothetical protein [Phytoactinopolyspora halotolerans]|uniref:Uncharacterized protein n=1 Tax=Phytoactinopolyspora halotolerans TaxID=1981512 RepID=A0A6L9SEA2_9ACTN|nr:hypothetical protein [Phytoactinopolyspora halotolerans]NEE02878.1 hypothetical protein [Phytoactinopolyspora halotolerans]
MSGDPGRLRGPAALALSWHVPPKSLTALCASAVLVAVLASCAAEDDEATADLDRSAARLVDDGAAVVEILSDSSVDEVSDVRTVYDGSVDEACGDGGARRVWRTDLKLVALAGDPEDPAAVNREFDDLYTHIDAELARRGYENPVWADSDTDAPGWAVFAAQPADDGETSREIRATFQLAPEQPDDAMAIDIDLIGSTPCVETSA